jgi:hypothetical protein
MSLAFFKTGDVSREGATGTYSVTAESGNTVTRHFCATCGSRVFTENTGRPGLIGIAVGSADSSDWFEPAVVVYTRNRAKWDRTSTEIPNFESAQIVQK